MRASSPDEAMASDEVITTCDELITVVIGIFVGGLLEEKEG